VNSTHDDTIDKNGVCQFLRSLGDDAVSTRVRDAAAKELG
jgi:hypothetical protein